MPFDLPTAAASSSTRNSLGAGGNHSLRLSLAHQHAAATLAGGSGGSRHGSIAQTDTSQMSNSLAEDTTFVEPSTSAPPKKAEGKTIMPPEAWLPLSMELPEPLKEKIRLVPQVFQESRHIEAIVGTVPDEEEQNAWRKYSRERMKTVSVALVLCLHIGVDPPDLPPRPHPHAKLQAWIDPQSCNAQRAMQKIAEALQNNYVQWQPRARYRTTTDPTLDDVRKLCQGMRRNAKDERVLFHYNGHGVPTPTTNGEIWVFNKQYTQYIPLSIYDLQSWMECPSIYVWDAPCAGLILEAFRRFADDHDKEWTSQLTNHMESTVEQLPPITANMSLEEQAHRLNFRPRPQFHHCIQLGATSHNERLPTHPDLPADLFTSALTTPIQASILWYLVSTGRRAEFSDDVVNKIPGKLTDRRTLLGELNWIFTAITDTIAWNTLQRPLFQRLFRQDLLLASLFRNFLLAERVMRANGCHVVSFPQLPSVADHPLWDSWDYTLDLCLKQMSDSLDRHDDLTRIGRDIYVVRSKLFDMNLRVPLALYESQYSNDQTALNTTGEVNVNNWFFIEQLKAFEVYLEYGVDRMRPPQQLPVVLQVLLSQVHRLRALELLARFLDRGQWAVGYALSVGIFPYVLKLLQSNTRELRPWLCFIWAKILAVDPGCKGELFKENGDEVAPPGRLQRRHLRYFYFLSILNDSSIRPRHKVVPAFIIATLFHNNFRVAQENLTERGFVNLAMELLTDPTASRCRLLKLWILIALGRLWNEYNPARWQAVRLMAYKTVVDVLADPAPEVRTAAIYALGCLIRNRSETNEHAAYIDSSICDSLCKQCTHDGSVLVREELVCALQWYVIDFERRFAALSNELRQAAGGSDHRSTLVRTAAGNVAPEQLGSSPYSTLPRAPSRKPSLPSYLTIRGPLSFLTGGSVGTRSVYGLPVEEAEVGGRGKRGNSR